MQLSHNLSPFAQTLNKSEEWMHDIQCQLGTPNAESVYRATRGTLHALRDQLIPTEATDLAAQLPMLLRGLFFEGYRLTNAPDRIRSCDQFLQRIACELQPGADPGPQQAACAVFKAIEHHVSRGEVKDVRNMLPESIRKLWPRTEEGSQMHA